MTSLKNQNRFSLLAVDSLDSSDEETPQTKTVAVPVKQSSQIKALPLRSSTKFARRGDRTPRSSQIEKSKDGEWNTVRRRGAKKTIPSAVLKQRELCKKYKYSYKELENGNILNNSTLYVRTNLATYEQVDAVMKEALLKTKKILGNTFECDYVINLVQAEGKLAGYAFIDVSNPAFYYILTGCNPNGSERHEYIPDPDWKPPVAKKETVKPPSIDSQKDFPSLSLDTIVSWGDDDFDLPAKPPMVKRELPPLIEVGYFEYTDEQIKYLQEEEDIEDEDHDFLEFSPAFFSPGVNDDHDDCSLYVENIPNEDDDTLRDMFYPTFARYARSTPFTKSDNIYFPRIKFSRHTRNGETIVRTVVTYASHKDAGFALHMLRKIHAKYGDEDITIRCRYARHGRGGHNRYNRR